MKVERILRLMGAARRSIGRALKEAVPAPEPHCEHYYLSKSTLDDYSRAWRAFEEAVKERPEFLREYLRVVEGFGGPGYCPVKGCPHG